VPKVKAGEAQAIVATVLSSIGGAAVGWGMSASGWIAAGLAALVLGVCLFVDDLADRKGESG